MKDYYKILGVDRDSTSKEIKKSYRNLSKKYHPDVSKDPNAESIFKDISEAYSVLSNDQKRNEYDNPMNSYGSSNDNYGGFNDFFSGFEFNFEDMFRGGSNNRNQSQRSQNKRGSDIRVSINVSLDEIDQDTSKKIKYNRKKSCDRCDGKGGTDIIQCNDCNGNGHRIRVVNTPIGSMREQVKCYNCEGTGKKIKNICGKCHGSKSEKFSEEIEIKIPSTNIDNSIYKYSNKGNSNKNGTGDLIVQFNILNHHKFRLQGINLLYEINLPINVLLLGSEIEIIGLNNKTHTLKVPKLSNVGNILRIPNAGLKSNLNQKGDLIVILNIEIPKTLSDIEEKVLSDLNNQENFIYKDNK